jgi:dolichol-phosphate mannosyltransferase
MRAVDVAPARQTAIPGLPVTTLGSAWLVLPTYNEADNIERVVRAADDVMRGAAGQGHHVLVVDDNSPDGTGDIANRLAEELPAVSVLHRPGKGGIAAAYLAGFEMALDAGAGLIMQMDSDLSHAPADLAHLLAAAAAGADLVLGSRYVDGGGVSNWGLVRRIVSRSGCWYARRVLGVGVRDLTVGFKCFRRHALESIDLHAIRSGGYAFQVELTYRAIQHGLRVVEVPIVFRERELGQSKMSLRIAVEAMLLVPRLRGRVR